MRSRGIEEETTSQIGQPWAWSSRHAHRRRRSFLVERVRGDPTVMLHGRPRLTHPIIGENLDPPADTYRFTLIDRRIVECTGRCAGTVRAGVVLTHFPRREGGGVQGLARGMASIRVSSRPDE